MEYMTAGELAQKVGITLRSVQYYDQQGLLHPAERGPNNLRLYSPDDQQRLYRILVLKYLGLTLSQIRDTLDEYTTSDTVVALINSRIAAVETEFHDLFRRLQAFHEIKDDLVKLQRPDWHELASVIENVQDQGPSIWQMIATIDQGAGGDEDPEARREYLIRLHELLGEAMELMKSGKPPTSPASRDFAERARVLFDGQDERLGQSTFIMGNAFHASAGHPGFGQMSSQVTAFIQSIIAANPPADEGRTS